MYIDSGRIESVGRNRGIRMRKKIKDITFEEFSEWANKRASDGAWSMQTAIICIEAAEQVYAVNQLFSRKKKREEKWNEIKGDYFILDSEIEV